MLDCRTRYEGDGTALAVTFFKDPDAPTVHDAGAALRELLPTGTAVNPFTDSHGQAWRYGMRSGAAGDGTFTPYSQIQISLYDNSGLNAWALNGGKLPRIFVNATGAPAVYQDSQHHPFPLLMPDEIFAHPGPPGDATRAPFIRWIAPSNGLYRAHGLVRDVDSVADPTFNDGVTRCFAVPGSVVDARCVSIDQNQSQNAFAKDRNMRGYEVCDAPYLFLRAGEWIDSVLLHNVQYNNDATFLSFAVTAQADPFAGQAFLNIRFGDEAEGATPRLGWRDEQSWTCRAGWAARGVPRADGSRRTNAAVALGAGTEIVTGLAAGAPLQTQGLRAAGPDETKRFTLSGLKPGAEYTLAVYSLTGRWRTDTLAFEANGVTEPAESLTAYGVPDSVQLFRAAADDAGVIACSFTSSVAGQPAVVNAVQVIGDVPDYVALGTVILMR